jgi:hypothetical protein
MSSLSRTPEKTDRHEIHEAYEKGKEYSPDDVCHHCARCPTGEMDEDTSILNEVKQLAGWVKNGESSLSPPDPKSHSLFCDELYSAFRKGFFESCTTPAECRICSDPMTMCYHERQGLGGYCPHTGGNKEVY